MHRCVEKSFFYQRIKISASNNNYVENGNSCTPCLGMRTWDWKLNNYALEIRMIPLEQHDRACSQKNKNTMVPSLEFVPKQNSRLLLLIINSLITHPFKYAFRRMRQSLHSSYPQQNRVLLVQSLMPDRQHNTFCQQICASLQNWTSTHTKNPPPKNPTRVTTATHVPARTTFLTSGFSSVMPRCAVSQEGNVTWSDAWVENVRGRSWGMLLGDQTHRGGTADAGKWVRRESLWTEAEVYGAPFVK